MTVTVPFPGDMIRPWYPGGDDIRLTTTHRRMVLVGHLYADCEELLRVDPEPKEGAGWLDPRQPGTCQGCLYRHDPKLHAEIFGDDDEDAA